MKRVFRIVLETNRFARFETAECKEFLKTYVFDGTKIPGDSQYLELDVPEMAPNQTKLPRPDIWSLCGCQQVMVLNQRAYDLLQTIMYSVGQAIPFRFEDQRYMIMNITECLDVLDSKKSRKAADGSFDKYVFDDSHLGSMVFSVPQTSDHELFAFEQDGVGRMDMFKSIVEDHELTGVRFVELFKYR
jgi:hypothetical protein